jgi:OOP family OmpA-OmpF porin
MRSVILLLLAFYSINGFGQTIDKSYDTYDFIAGEKTLFEDNLIYKSNEKPLAKWSTSGNASIIDFEGQKCISINAYYTKLTPLLFGAKKMPDSLTIEYDTWLDQGYDGNPGIEIHLLSDESEVLITPNKHAMSVSYPNDGRESKDNPTEYFGENKFYNRWVHISIAQYRKHLLVYLDQYKMIDIADFRLTPKTILVTGNTSENMKILLKNFRIATAVPKKIAFSGGKFITHAIKFDVNKYELKPESISVIRELYNYLKANAADKLEIGGHTDNDGTEEYNLKLSQSRADAVRNQLVSMGIDKSRLLTKGYGQSKPIDVRNTPEAKAINRRVEFTKL